MKVMQISMNRKKYIIYSTVLLLSVISCFIFSYFMAFLDNENQYIFCFVKRMLKIYCPGCGATRAVYCLFHADIINSVLYNPCILYIGIVVLYYYMKMSICIVKNKDNYIKVNEASIWSVLIALLLFFVVRNVLLVAGIWDYPGDLGIYYGINH